MEMEYTRAFTFAQQDPAWARKWALAGAVSLVPAVGQLVMAGYSVEVARRVIRDEAPPLPEWSDFAEYLRKGLGAVVIGLVYWLPLILVILCASVPLILLSVSANAGRGGSLDGFASVLSLCIVAFGVVYGLLAAMLVQAALGQYAATDQIGAGLRIGEIFGRVRAKPGLYFVVAIVSGLGALILALVGLIACLVGAAWGGAYAQLAHGHLVGQAYRFQSQPNPNN